MTAARTVLVPATRVARWFENFQVRHGPVDLSVDSDHLCASAQDGGLAEARLPFGRAYDGQPDAAAFADVATAALHWGILLVRKGGFAVATVHGQRIATSKVGQRHVQGRTKAGGQSQQRFARRRDNQARQAYEAAAEHAHRILVLEAGHPLDALVCGGDRPAVEAVLGDPRLVPLCAVRTDPWLAVPDPRRGVLEQAVVDGSAVSITLRDPD